MDDTKKYKDGVYLAPQIIRKFWIRNQNDIQSSEMFLSFQDAWKIQNKPNFKKYKLEIEWKDFLIFL